MKIKLDEKHFLNSDAHCFWITCEVNPKKGEKQDRYEKRVSGYCATLKQTVESYIDRKIRGSEVDKLKKLKNEIEELKAQVESWEIELKRSNND